jgi:hypothetical protein
MALNRYTNYAGNVIAPASPSNYACLASNSSGTCGRYNANVYWIGYCQATSSCPYTDVGTMGYDTLSPTYFMRWANWDTSTNAVRFCGNSSDTGWSTTCGSTTEIPSGLANYAAIIPTLGDTGAGQTAMPASFYFASKPGFWQSEPWPPIGPDVSGGNITGTSGHANTNPAEDCYTSISGNSANFNAATCYPALSTYTITISSITGSGTVTSSDSVINCTTGTTGTCVDSSASGTVTLTAAPAGGYTFSSWGGGTCSGSSSTCAVSSTATVTATFTLSGTPPAPASLLAVHGNSMIRGTLGFK